jgi:hyaluronoglucosaminidase
MVMPSDDGGAPGSDAAPSMDAGPKSCDPLASVDAGNGSADGIYPDPRIAEMGAYVASVKTACVDTSGLASHATLDAMIPAILAEAGLKQAPLGDCACEWTLRFGAAAPMLDANAQKVLDAGKGNAELYASVTNAENGRPVTSLYATSERGGLYAIRSAIATSAKGLVPAATIVDWPEIVHRGIVDGIYGALGNWPGAFASWPARYTPAMRAELLELMSRLRGNTFIYGPKVDPWARGPQSGARPNWRDAYPANNGMQSAIQTIALLADQNLVDFYWSISPFPTFDWNNPTGPDFDAVKKKIDEVRALGVHKFAMFVDDASVNGGTPSQNAALMNGTHRWLKMQDPNAHLLVVTWAYAGGPWSATDAYGAALDKDIEVMWTGPGIESCSIAGSNMTAIDKSYQRKLSIWDNWPAASWDSKCAANTDRKMVNRSADLPGTIDGYYTNPVINEEGSPLADEIAQLGPIFDWAWGAGHYDANIDGSYARWAKIRPAMQGIVHPCNVTDCHVNGSAYQGFACDPNDTSSILFCDQYENNCVTKLRCPKNCVVQNNAQDTCAP